MPGASAVNVTLLGPQRRSAAARAAVAELLPDGPIATVNAGWRERERDSAELAEVLAGRMVNLELYRRWQDLVAEDEEYAVRERELSAQLRELQAAYGVRLHHAISAWQAVMRRDSHPAMSQLAAEDALRVVRELDRWQLATVAEARAGFYSDLRIGDRDSVCRHRAEVADLVRSATGMVFAGGHVGVLLHLLHIFALGALLKPPLIAWSAGAMALSDQVVLLHDFAPYGPSHAEVFAAGLGAYGGVLPFPHARRRLRLDDRDHVGLLARRFAPLTCLLLADGERVDVRSGEPLPAGVRRLTEQGVELLEPALVTG